MATSKITEVLNYFKNGFQRTNRFEVTVNRNGPVTFWASQCQIPSQTLVYYPDTSFSPSGPSIPIPVKREYDERFLIDFIVDGNWYVRDYFETWMDKGFSPLVPVLNGPKSNNITFRNNTEFLGEVTIKAISGNDTTKAYFTLYEAYPKLLLPSQFSNDTPDQYLTLTVDFNYRYYRFHN